MAADSTEIAPPKAKKPTGRSKVTNGSKLSPKMDGRGVWPRRLRDLIEAYEGDLGKAEDLSAMKRSLVRRAATMTVELERAEEEFSKAGKADPEGLARYQTTASALRRLLESLGVNAQVKGAAELENQLAGLRVAQAAFETMGLTGLALCYGTEEARIVAANKLKAGLAHSEATGEPLPDHLIKLATDLAIASVELPAGSANDNPHGAVNDNPGLVREVAKRPAAVVDFNINTLSIDRSIL